MSAAEPDDDVRCQDCDRRVRSPKSRAERRGAECRRRRRRRIRSISQPVPLPGMADPTEDGEHQ